MAKKTFEQSLKQLEQLVAELESGELSLEQAMKKFEEGMELSRFCAQKLEETERRITLLMRDSSGQTVEKPFALNEQEEAPDADG
jgi:exodeoxyribonuclease VII small subunit